MRQSPIPGMAIHYDVASAQHAQQAALTKRTRHLQAVALNEFRNSYCDLFDARDLQFYARETGKDLHWLVEHAKWEEAGGLFGYFMDNAIANRDTQTLELIESFMT